MGKDGPTRHVTVEFRGAGFRGSGVSASAGFGSARDTTPDRLQSRPGAGAAAPMNCKRWLEINAGQLANSWERLFVDTVLTRIAELNWASIETQLPFRDGDGRQRYADFAISEGEHVRIVLEVDGYDKRGRGTGMTAEEFVDWQRRQNALIDQGWSVLRFANRDVRDHPARCAEHITLLLRQQRHAMKHHENLHRSILELEKKLQTSELRVAETSRTYGASLEEERKAAKAAKRDQARLERELKKVRDEMKLAETAPALDTADSQRLLELNEKQKEELEALGKLVQAQSQQIKEGEVNQDTMKTTIWAFTLLMVVAMVLLVYVLVGRDGSTIPSAPTVVGSIPEQTVQEPAAPARASAPPAVPIGENCRNPADWTTARQFVGQRAALQGQITGITYRPELNGQPTWVSIGSDFPNRNRLELVIWGRNRSTFESELRRLSVGDEICAVGQVSEFRGVVQIELQNAAQLSVR